MASSTGSPCGACKFLRRKCASDCVFAPYFCSDEGPAGFAAIHRVFGASNVSKLLLHLPTDHRCEAVVTIAYEAQARVRDPVYGCVSHIFALQQQVVCLQAQLMQVKAQLAQNYTNTTNAGQSHDHLWGGAGNGVAPSPSYPTIDHTMMMSSVSPQSSHESTDLNYSSSSDHSGFNGSRSEELFDFLHQSAAYCDINNKKIGVSSDDLSELQAIAFGMMRNS